MECDACIKPQFNVIRRLVFILLGTMLCLGAADGAMSYLGSKSLAEHRLDCGERQTRVETRLNAYEKEANRDRQIFITTISRLEDKLDRMNERTK